MMFSLDQLIKKKKASLVEYISEPMQQIAEQCAQAWNDRSALESLLEKSTAKVPYANLTYLVSLTGQRLSCGVVTNGLEDGQSNDRLFMERAPASSNNPSLMLSHAYLRRARGASLTAFNEISVNNSVVGYLAADFDVHELPLVYSAPRALMPSRQFRGDPAIRGTLFMQKRHNSVMDQNSDHTLGLISMLMREHGAFHSRIHFSSSRFTLWTLDNPYDYHLHSVDDILNPDVCLAYPKQSYPSRAKVSADKIDKVFDRLKELRGADDTVYLRVASLNIMNGMVELTFSCDGSHYMSADEFIEKDMGYWFGNPAPAPDNNRENTVKNRSREAEGCDLAP